MYLTDLDEITGDDYEAHLKITEIFDGQKVLFQRRGNRIAVLSGKPVSISRDVSEILESIKVGSEHLLVVRLNPVVTRFIGGKNRRVALESPKIKAWLDQTLVKHGCNLNFAFKVEGVRRSRKGFHTISLMSVLVNGVATVSDPVLFRTAVEKGIGHGKGLGFGFLNIFDFV